MWCSTLLLYYLYRLDCHPKMVMRSTEVQFFEDEEKVKQIIAAWKSSNHELIQYYRIMYARSLPRSAPDEILIEKSPQYISKIGSNLQVLGSLDFMDVPKFQTRSQNPWKNKQYFLDKALAMRIINPDMKIILTTCDPIRNGNRKWTFLKMFSTIPILPS